MSAYCNKTNKKGVSQEILDALIAGDHQAFTIVFNHYYQRLYHYVLSCTQSHYACEEVVQKVFIKIWEKRKDIRTQTFNTFLFTIARNLAYNHNRDTLRREMGKEYLRNSSIACNPTEDRIKNQEYQRIAEAAIERLPPRKKSIYLFSQKTGKNNQQIAEAFHITPKTVKNHLWKIKQYLRNCLSPHLC